MLSPHAFPVETIHYNVHSPVVFVLADTHGMGSNVFFLRIMSNLYRHSVRRQGNHAY